MSVSLGCAGVLDLVSALHPGEDLHVSVLLRLGVVLKLSKLGIALLLQNLLRGRSVRLSLADFFVEAAHAGGTELSQLERLLESLSLTLLNLLLLDLVVLGLAIR